MRAPVGTVTLFFSDIEGSTRLLEQLGDAYAAVLQDHRRIVRDALAAHAGHEVDTEGDGFFVAFARAADAVRAAVAAQRGLAAGRWPAGVSVRVRIGLHTGEPRVVGGGYIGLDVHRAARICAAAHGGQIVLSESTAKVLSGQVIDGLAMRDLGEHRLKDVAGPVRLYQLMADGLVADFPPLRALERRTMRRPGAFLGRRAELAALVEGLDDAVAGRGRLFLLAGEPGIGKSSLAEALAGEAQSRGARVLLGRCWQAGGAPAYWPWTEALRLYVRESDDDTLAARLGSRAVDLTQVVPELRERFPHLPPPSPAPPEHARFRLFDAISGFLRDAAQDRPILLVLDDLHAADEPSLLALRFLTRALGRMRVLIVGAYRDVDPTPGPALIETLDGSYESR
jgi:class 3 adenylate cyclase